MPSWESDALIVDAVRSPIGRKKGTLSSIRGDELAGQVLNGLLARNDVDPGEVEDVQLGCVTQIGEQGWNIGRMVPVEVSNRHVGTLSAVAETPRRDTSAEALPDRKPAFLPEGKVTAGNSSQICDGAAGVLITSKRKASELGLEPRARFLSFG